MKFGIGIRIAGILCAVFVGGGLSIFFLSPALFEHIPIDHISTGAFVAGVGFAVFGVWMLLVACVAPVDELRKVLLPFETGEVVVLFLPYMLFVGTRSLWRAMIRKASSKT